MSCGRWKEELQEWLQKRAWSADMPGSVPSEIEAHAGRCPECGKLLKAALLLMDGGQLRKSPPEDLSHRVTARLSIEQRQRHSGWRVLLPVAAAVLVVFNLIFIVSRFSSNAERTVIVRFVLEAPNAREVSVVGDWNDWKPDTNRLRDLDGDGIWEIELKLKEGGEYRYQFLIDKERWIPDPKSGFQLDDGFGGVNSILQI